MNSSDKNSMGIDPETKENIARVLWMNEYNPGLIPPEIMEKINEEKNSGLAFGERMQKRLADLLASPESFTPDYTERYETFLTYSSEMSPHQAYSMTNLLGQDSVRGYKELTSNFILKVPECDRPQLLYQVGWHFFLGTAFDANNQEYGVQMMFWHYSLLPPGMAEDEGLSNEENQIVEMHLAISVANKRHYRSRPVVVAGTTGLIGFSDTPYAYEFGKNKLTSQAKDAIFPIRLEAWSIDNLQEIPVEIAIDITLNQTKGYILNGDKGMSPSCGGIGTLYYSVPNLQVDPAVSRLSIGGEKIQITGGKFWYDHQWDTGFMPQGSTRPEPLRAFVLTQEQKSVPGWDWMEIQFDDNTEIALSALHTPANIGFYFQTGPNPPGTMTADAKGSYILQNGAYSQINATIQVAEWVKSVVSDGPYAATSTWYPNRVEVTVNTNIVPADKRNFVMVPIVLTGQQGFFGSGAQ
ncbi:lipocalin-like domain-containing protein [Methanolacinia petrolearia]|uniref:lipocalin-like domain-containing protein n=1 Tax=Methanolacinia petrolearia TaxID=54120 RepID=UPI003BAC585A